MTQLYDIAVTCYYYDDISNPLAVGSEKEGQNKQQDYILRY